MATEIRPLKTDTTFTRTDSYGMTYTRHLPAGTRVRVEKIESETETAYIARVTLDGFGWTWEKSYPKAPAAVTPAPAPTPVLASGLGHTKMDRWAREGFNEALAAAEAATAPLTTQAISNTHGAATAVASREAGHSVKGTDAMERNIDHKQKLVNALDGKLYQVNYCIPVRFEKVIANPSRIFRRYGVRLDGSNWVFTEKGLNHPDVQGVFKDFNAVQAVQSVNAAGYTITDVPEYWAVPYHPEVVAEVRAKAEVKLRRELIDLHTSLITRIGTASDRLAAARAALPEDATEGDKDKVEDAFFGSMRGNLRDAINAFEDALKAAEVFDENGKLADLFSGIRGAIRAEALAFNVETAAAGRKPVKLPATI